MVYAWLIAAILFVVIESVTTQLISIWFAAGAVAAFIAALAGGNLTVQWSLFIAFSLVLLIATKPLVKKLTKNSTAKTNVESNIGKITVVTSKIDNIAETGEVKLNGLVWSARSLDGEVIEEGSKVIVKKVEGVKLIVTLSE